MEEQCAARGAERQVAQLVQDHEIKLGEAFGELNSLPFGLLLFKCVDLLDSREETDLSAVMFDGLHTKGCRDMGFTGRHSLEIMPKQAGDMIFRD